MAVIKAVSSKAGMGQALDYVTKEEKTEDKLVSGLHCEPDTVKDEMQATKELWGKTGGRTYKHFVQSYHEDEHITPEQAHKNAVELAKNTEAWKGHEVLIATHIDRGHIHSHIIVNSVNYENGHKLQWSKADKPCCIGVLCRAYKGGNPYQSSFTADTGTYRLCADKVVCKRVYEVKRVLLN